MVWRVLSGGPSAGGGAGCAPWGFLYGNRQQNEACLTQQERLKHWRHCSDDHTRSEAESNNANTDDVNDPWCTSWLAHQVRTSYLKYVNHSCNSGALQGSLRCPGRNFDNPSCRKPHSGDGGAVIKIWAQSKYNMWLLYRCSTHGRQVCFGGVGVPDVTLTVNGPATMRALLLSAQESTATQKCE